MNKELQEEINELIQHVNGKTRFDESDEKMKRLIEIGRPAIPALIDILLHPNTPEDETYLDFQEVPAQMIGIIGVDKDQFARIVGEFNEGNTGCAFVLGWINDQQGIDLLVKEFGKDRYYDMDLAIAAGLGYSGNEKALKPLIKNLDSHDTILKCEIIRALTKIVTGNHEKRYLFDEVLRELGILLRKEKDDIVQEEALGALGDMEDILGLDMVIESIENGCKVHHALNAIKKIALANELNRELSKAVPYVLEMLESGNEAIRKEAALVLGFIGDPATVPNLIQTMKDDDLMVRLNAMDALGIIGNAEAVKAIINAYLDGDDIIHSKVEDVLTVIYNYDAGPVLFELVKDQSYPLNLRILGAHALGNMGEPFMEKMTGLYTEGKIEHEIADAYFTSFSNKLEEGFYKGTVSPPKKPPKNPDEMKRMLMKKLQHRRKPGKKKNGVLVG
jgi:HEAT repeat protein